MNSARAGRVQNLREYCWSSYSINAQGESTPHIEAALMLLWGLAAGVLPFFYLLTIWLNWANLPCNMPVIIPCMVSTGRVFPKWIFFVTFWVAR
ncbi:MAG: hypothetical protein D3923_03290 [Candidatus Electrothrix sp. AR3]|nr:hypothetical protein [Candidatus Electrothrix sp. AR3]